MTDKEQIYFSYLDRFIFCPALRFGINLPDILGSRYVCNTCIPTRDRLETYIKKKGGKDNPTFRPTLVFLIHQEGLYCGETEIAKVFKKSCQENLLMIDLCDSPLTREELSKFNELSINSDLKNSSLEDFFENWKERVSQRKCRVYTVNDRDGVYFDDIYSAYDHITDFTKVRFPLALEWQKTGDAPSSDYIDTVRERIHQITDREIKSSGRISLSEIISELKKPPFGFLNNQSSAYVMSLAMQDYTEGSYQWSNGIYYDILDESHLLNGLEKAMHQAYNNIPTYTEEYIIVPDERTLRFISQIRDIFDMEDEINSCEILRKRLRILLESWDAPLWAYKDSFDDNEKALIDEILCFVRGGDIFEIPDTEKLKNLEKAPHKEITLPKSGALMTPQWKWMWQEDSFYKILLGYGD